MLCHLHGYPWPSLAIPLYRSLLLAGSKGYIPYPHRADVFKLDLIALLLLGYVRGSIYIYIYCYPQTDCFVVWQLFNMVRYIGRLKLGSKPAELYIRLNILPLKPGGDIRQLGNYKVLYSSFRLFKECGSFLLDSPWNLTTRYSFFFLSCSSFCLFTGTLVDWVVVLFYVALTLFESFNAELNFKQFFFIISVVFVSNS